ncbi:MAG: hypothetical protein DI596_02920 [Azospira oryzae]|uniref:Uncharacterized protein n=1 Tax=Pelomicrobium methylotrophicum TaxID=2602750 RepID=A0A5C7ET48_9PROT|nr:MAG: hypothetical protein DI596_02920 [Azospira oryzae]PZP81997.1 MAG: hypothetical protein DI593_02920 [Azospira oryzae]TXF10496.1 hypothetical protein FR698_14840 [Pelomicrobium methylotrophicum]
MSIDLPFPVELGPCRLKMLYLAVPDLEERLAPGAPLDTSDPATFYGDGERGYTPIPFSLRRSSRKPPATCLRAPHRQAEVAGFLAEVL